MEEAKKIKIGIMGCKRGGPFIRIFSTIDDVVVPAVCENDPETVESIKKEYPGVKIYSEFDEFIDSGLDAVFLANFFHEHALYAMKSMKKGIAVLSETTAAPSLGECVDLVETAEATNARYNVIEEKGETINAENATFNIDVNPYEIITLGVEN